MVLLGCFCGQCTEPTGLKISQSCPTRLTHQPLQQESRNFSYPQVETVTVRETETEGEQQSKMWRKDDLGLRSLEGHEKYKKQMHFLF